MAMSAESAEEQEREMQTQVSIAQTIEALVNGADHPLIAAEVREGLLFYGYDIDRYQNPVSMIQQTLARLAVAGRIKALAGGRYERNTFYQRFLQP
jgi:hypothetical protein